MAVCRSIFFLNTCLVGTFLSFFPSVCGDGGLKLSLPYLPPLLCTFLSLLQQHRKMGHEERKKWQRKTEMRSNLILIWFLLGSCFNPLWAGFFFLFLRARLCVSNSQGLKWRVADSRHSRHAIKETSIHFYCNQQKITPSLNSRDKIENLCTFLWKQRSFFKWL